MCSYCVVAMFILSALSGWVAEFSHI